MGSVSGLQGMFFSGKNGLHFMVRAVDTCDNNTHTRADVSEQNKPSGVIRQHIMNPNIYH
jgi:hypothetical protein